MLWPPNHKLVAISIQGVTDPDGDQLSLRVTGITQDEPVNGLGDGNTSPDGFGIETDQAQIRAERSGKGNGRVYAITFTADDGKGGACTGQVMVGVPHVSLSLHFWVPACFDARSLFVAVGRDIANESKYKSKSIVKSVSYLEL